MADIQSTSTANHSRKPNPKVDLTPLVDLAFLLITFFIFTTTMSSPVALHLNVPADSKDSSNVAASSTISLIAGGSKVLYFRGLHADDGEMIDYNDPDKLRNKLMALQQQLIRENGNDEKMFVLIKPTEQANLSQVVQLLDEMKICGIRSYSIVDLAPKETEGYAHF